MTSSGFTLSGLSYLATNYLWWWVAALLIGVVIGFSTFTRDKKSLGWFPWLLLLAAGIAVSYLKIVPDRLGLWFDTGILMASSYFVGCLLGGLLRQLFGAAETKPVETKPVAQAPKAAPAAALSLPEIMPYQWQAQKDGDVITLVGFAPSADAKSRILASAKAVFSGSTVNDRLQLGSGEPKGFETLSGAAFNHLAKLDKGIASLVDGSYTLTGAAGSGDIKTDVETLAKSLPSGFRLARVNVSAPVEVAAVPVDTDKPAGLLSPRAGSADDLKRIRGIGKQNETRLHGLGIWHFDQIAAWNTKEVQWVGHFLAFPGRIEREDWVAQAKVLATGAETEFSKRVDKGEVATSSGGHIESRENVVSLKIDGGYEGKRPSALDTPRNSKADNLKLINGVGAAIEKKLNEAGIWHFDQVAQMSNDELTWVSAYSGFPNKAIRENWKGDAAILAVGGETDHSKAVKAGKIA